MQSKKDAFRGSTRTGSAASHHAAAIELHDLARHPEELWSVHRHDHHVVLRELTYDFRDKLDPRAIEVCLGLVQEKHRSIAAQHSSESDALPLTHRENIDADIEGCWADAAESLGEADAIDSASYPLVGSIWGQKPNRGPHAESWR